MSLEAEIRQQVVTYSELPSNRVALGFLPEGTARPYINMNVISNVRRYTHDGYNGMSEARVQVSVFGATYAQSKDVAKKLYSLDNYSSQLIKFVMLDNAIEGYNDTANNHSVLLDFIIKYEE